VLPLEVYPYYIWVSPKACPYQTKFIKEHKFLSALDAPTPLINQTAHYWQPIFSAYGIPFYESVNLFDQNIYPVDLFVYAKNVTL